MIVSYAISELALCFHSSPEGYRLAGFCFSRVQFLLWFVWQMILPVVLGLHPGLVRRRDFRTNPRCNLLVHTDAFFLAR